jgi:hypothetical protein
VEQMERLIGIMDCEEEQDRRLELVLETDGTPRLAIKLATYCEGLGWNTQKTIYIDAQQAEQMHFLLGGARYLLKQAMQSPGCEKAEAESPRAAKVVKFAAADHRKSA